jgi:hypothetical protein
VASLHSLVADFKKSFLVLKDHPLLSTAVSPPSLSSVDRPPDTFSQLYFKAHELLRQSGLSDIKAFLANPRLDDVTYLTTLSILLAAVFITMSWLSRAGSSWGGRFSPFGRPPSNPNATEVNDGDFSYITDEDLANQASKAKRRPSSSRPEIVDWDDADPERETDKLVFKAGRTNYPCHFPAQSIRDGDLRISTVRQAAAKKIGIDDPRRIRMFHKGRNLKHDDRTAREEGLRGDGSGSEILCVIGEAGSGAMAPGAADAQASFSDNEDDDDDEDDATDSGTAQKKKPRRRGGRKSKKKTSGTSTPSGTYSNTNSAGAEFLPIPSHFAGPRPSSATGQSTPQAATPQTPIGKLDAIASKFHTEFVPRCVTFMQSPPPEKEKREFEYKKLSETILAQILLKLDGVETEGDGEARARRKEVVREVQNMLNTLDETMK